MNVQTLPLLRNRQLQPLQLGTAPQRSPMAEQHSSQQHRERQEAAQRQSQGRAA